MKKGFTLIELLIVISIIGILAALITVSFTAAQRQARDAARKSDLAQYRTALEAYASANNGLYPAPIWSGNNVADLCKDYSLGDYAADCPDDPSHATSGNWYIYYSNSPGGTATGTPSATKYVLLVGLGLESDPDNTWVECSTGKVGKVLVAGQVLTNAVNFCGGF